MGPTINVDMRNATMTGSDFSLAWIECAEVNSSTNVSSSSFSGAYIVDNGPGCGGFGATMQDCDVTGADVPSANLNDADYCRSDFEGAFSRHHDR